MSPDQRGVRKRLMCVVLLAFLLGMAKMMFLLHRRDARAAPLPVTSVDGSSKAASSR